jgi:hypothetical protein
MRLIMMLNESVSFRALNVVVRCILACDLLMSAQYDRINERDCPY